MVRNRLLGTLFGSDAFTFAVGDGLNSAPHTGEQSDFSGRVSNLPGDHILPVFGMGNFGSAAADSTGLPASLTHTNIAALHVTPNASPVAPHLTDGTNVLGAQTSSVSDRLGLDQLPIAKPAPGDIAAFDSASLPGLSDSLNGQIAARLAREHGMTGGLHQGHGDASGHLSLGLGNGAHPFVNASASGGGDPTGQLWEADNGVGSGNPDGHSDFRIMRADSDGLSNDQITVQTQSSGGGYNMIGLDTAADLVFTADNHYNLRVTNMTTGADDSTTIAGSASDGDLIWSMAVDPRTDTIYYYLFGGDYQDANPSPYSNPHGADILEFKYNPATGAITQNPFDPAGHGGNGDVTATGDILLDGGSAAHSGINFGLVRGMVLSNNGSTLYYADDNDGDPLSEWGFKTNGIYSVSTSGNVGAGTAPTPTLLSVQSQFPTTYANGYITGISVNEAQGIIYIVTDASGENVNTSQDAIYWMPITGGTATKMTLPAGVTLDYASFNGNGITFDPDARDLYVSDVQRGVIFRLELSADGKSFVAIGAGSDTTNDFHTIDTNSSDGGLALALVFDTLPTETSVNGTAAHTTQGSGLGTTLLTGAPAISDPDGAGFHLAGETIRVIGGTKGDGTAFGVTSGAIATGAGLSGDNLLVGGVQSGTVDGGKVTVSWNASTETLTLSGNEPDSDYQTLLQGITFQENANTDNTIGSHPTRVIDFIANDGVTVSHPTTTDPNEKTITITLNRAPTLGADSYAVQESGSASGTSGTGGTGVLGNDSDPDGDSITVIAIGGSGAAVGNSIGGNYGHLTLNANGSFTYNADDTATIDSGPTGSHLLDTFTYTVSDGDGGLSSQTVSFTLNRAPTVVGDSGAAVEASSGTGNVLTNDSDKDGDTLTVSAVNGVGGNVGASVAGTYGHITIAANGSYTYNADNTSAIDGAATGSHLTDTFTYTASDAHGGATTTTITVTLDRAPTVVADAGTSVESSSGTGNVLTNDSDRDGDTLTVSAVAGSAGNVAHSVAGTYGHLTLNGDGSYTYLADNTAAIDGAATGSHLTDTFSYTANDGHGGTTTTNLVITLDRAPTVVADNPATNAVESGSALTGNVLTNDSDRDGDSLTVSAVAGLAGNVATSTAGTYGHLTLNGDGSYSYLADNTAAIDSAATGAHLTDTFSYTADDGHGGTTTTNLTVIIDRAPTVVADAGASVESFSGTGNVLTNDSDRDGDTLTVSAVAGSAGNVGASIAGTYGHVTINANGSYSYSADNTAAIDGAATGAHLTDTFAYTASDGHGGTTTTDLVITLDRAPTVANDDANVVESNTVSATAGTGVLTNDSDRDGDSLTVTAVGGSAGNVGASFATTYGHITLDADGSYSYVADNTAAIDGAATGSHPVDAVSVTVGDGHGGTTNETLSFTIDRPAIAADDDLFTNEVTPLSGSLFADNSFGPDHDPDGDSLSVAAVTGGTVGTQFTLPSGALLTVNADGSFAYDPNGAFDSLHLADPSSGAANTSTTDTFTYTLTGGSTATATATVVIDGVDTANTIYMGSAGNDTITGSTTLPDLFHLEQGGNDTATGGSADDGFYFGAAFTAADTVDGGGGTNNQIGLEGDYSAATGTPITLGPDTITNIQVIAMLPGFSYDLTTVDANVAAGQNLTIWAAHLDASFTLTFDGSAESDGSFTVFGGAGNDSITGGSGADTLWGLGGADTITGGAGADHFVYNAVSDSTGDANGTAYDTITDFDAAADKFDLPVAVTGVDTAIVLGTLDSGAGTFDTELAAAVNLTNLAAHHAVLFTPNLGTLAGHTFLIVDANGTAGYQAGQDFVFDVTGGNLASLHTTDFI